MPFDNFPEFSIDSTLELVADHFTAPFVGSELFRTAAPVDRISLTLGLLDGTQIKTIQQITQGVIDEYEITITPSSITGAIRGRDPSALILDRYFKKRYVRLPASDTVSSVEPDIGAIPEVEGRFMASHIAAEVVASVGLTLAYETQDYELLDSFEAVGRVVDILRNLIQPWTHVEPFRTDITLAGSTLTLKQRPFPIADPAYVLTLNDVRRGQVTIRRRATKKVGILTLRGARVADALAANPENLITGGFNNLFTTGTQTETQTIENFAPAGRLQGISHRVSVYEMPPHNLLRETKEEFALDGGGLILKTREIIENHWRVGSFDTAGQRSQPQQIDSEIRRSRIDDSDPDRQFMLWDVEGVGYDYNSEGFLQGETTTLSSLNLDSNVFVNSKQTVKTIRPKGSLLVEQITTNYTWDSNANQWLFVARDTQTQGGYPPGGPGRGVPVSNLRLAQPAIGGSRQLEIITQLSADADAEDIEINNSNLSLQMLQILLGQFQAAQGLFEYELSFDGIGMPFIQRGKSIQFVGVQDENGNLMTFPSMIITEVRSKYTEKTRDAQYTINARAFGWRAS